MKRAESGAWAGHREIVTIMNIHNGERDHKSEAALQYSSRSLWCRPTWHTRVVSVWECIIPNDKFIVLSGILPSSMDLGGLFSNP